MSPGRASSGSTSCRSFLPSRAFWTHVATPPQPPPSILCPFWASDQVTNDAHHGLPGGTPAADRNSSTFAPVLVHSSRTPSCDSAVLSAEVPRELLPAPLAAAVAASTAPGTAPGSGASAPGGPAGGW